MNIAYSVNGEGFGHASRLLTLAPGLLRWHRLTLFLPQTVSDRIKAELPRVPTRELPAFLLTKKADRILYFRTIASNLPLVFRSLIVIIRLARLLRRSGVDGVISDFEPFLAWAGKLAGVPVLQLNHPGIIRRFDRLNADWLAASLVSCLMEGPWDHRLLCSFYRGEIGPLIRSELLTQPRRRGDYLLINLKTGYHDTVVGTLERLKLTMPDLKWELFPRPGANFAQALAGCRAVISAGGHQMISEALVLGKPVLALPQAGQYEQELNARMLQASGRGLAGSLASLSSLLPEFVSALPRLERAAQSAAPAGYCFTDSTETALRKIGLAFVGKTVPGRSALPLTAPVRKRA